MLIQPTLDKLNFMKLFGMAIALSEQMTHGAAQGLSFEERLALLLEREMLHRENKRMTRLLQLAQFKQRATLEDLDYRARTGLDRSQLASLASCDWIRATQHVLIQGATGSGKTFLACALAHQACRNGLSALYVRAPRLFEELNLCHADGSFRKRLAAIAKISVLIIDDFAIAPIGPRERNDLLELIDDRVGTRSCIVTSQLLRGAPRNSCNATHIVMQSLVRDDPVARPISIATGSA
jgi:DNA replication protein DnaC